MGVFELYKPFRNRMAELSYEDSLYVTWAYSQYLQIDKFEIPAGIDVSDEFRKLKPRQRWIAEWELEILAKEVLINGRKVERKGRSFRSWTVLASAINQLKGLENAIYGLSSKDILIELTRIAHRQFVWQANPPNSTTTIRYFKIFNSCAINQITLDRLNLSVSDVYMCGMALIGNFLSHPAVYPPFTTDIRNLSEEKISKFLAITCLPISNLKVLLRSQQQYNEKYAYAYNSLREFPLIQMRFRGREAIVCPLPTLLYWRFTGGLYYELIHDPRFSQAFGMSFQRYVGEVVERACPSKEILLFSEQKYGTKKARKDSVDWIVSDDNAAIFLECKAKRLSWTAKTELDDLRALNTDISEMASAVVQVYKTIGDYNDDQYEHFSFSKDRKIYPVIVTLENWYLFGDAMFGRLREAVVEKLKAASIAEKIIDEMPYSLVPIEELEIGMQVVNAVGVQKFLDGKINDAEMKQWEWLSYIRQCFPKHLRDRKLFAAEYEEMFTGMVD